jgi:hypothetical protein
MLQGKDISQCKVHCTEMQCKNGRERETSKCAGGESLSSTRMQGKHKRPICTAFSLNSFGLCTCR